MLTPDEKCLFFENPFFLDSTDHLIFIYINKPTADT